MEMCGERTRRSARHTRIEHHPVVEADHQPVGGYELRNEQRESHVRGDRSGERSSAFEAYPVIERPPVKTKHTEAGAI